jgi:hypothetical protein
MPGYGWYFVLVGIFGMVAALPEQRMKEKSF